MPAAGDLIFFRGTGRWYERLIQARTGGPFVHVEIVRSPGESVGAIMRRGVERHPLPGGGEVAATSTACDPVRLRRALAWLDAQVGDHYGWYAIGDDVLLAAVPWWRAFVTVRRMYDCSQLAATFLAIADYGLPEDMLTSLETTSPNSLARVVGLLPDKKGR